jgi:hypothetical protein
VNDPHAGKDGPPQDPAAGVEFKPRPAPDEAASSGGMKVLKFLGGCAIAVLVVGALLFGTCLLLLNSH